MSTHLSKRLQSAKRSLKLLYCRLGGNQKCFACGFRGRFLTHQALWPELIAEWELTPQWAGWFEAREGQACPRCRSNLRSVQLAQAIIAAVAQMTGAAGVTLDSIFDHPKVRALSIAEINSAGTL